MQHLQTFLNIIYIYIYTHIYMYMGCAHKIYFEFGASVIVVVCTMSEKFFLPAPDIDLGVMQCNRLQNEHALELIM